MCGFPKHFDPGTANEVAMQVHSPAANYYDYLPPLVPHELVIPWGVSLTSYIEPKYGTADPVR